MKKLTAFMLAAAILPLSAAFAEARNVTDAVKPAHPLEPAALHSTRTRLAAGDASEPERRPAGSVTPARSERPEPFGRAGTTRLNLHGAYGVHISSTANRFGLLGGGPGYFIIDNISLNAELNGLYVDQRGPNAWAGNFNLLVRWHFLPKETWSLYIDGGAGLLSASNPIPPNGTRFNFTPQAGGGVSFETVPDIRIMLGIRWHHISNANTSGNNPGRDNVIGYVGVSLPF